jgi:hypothetical protein
LGENSPNLVTLMPEWQAGHESHFSKKRDRRCEKLISNFRTALQTLKKLGRFNDNFFSFQETV